jgi:hypothetical protein
MLVRNKEMKNEKHTLFGVKTVETGYIDCGKH